MCLFYHEHRTSTDHQRLVAHNSLFKVSMSFCLLFLNMLSLSHSVSLLCSALFIGYPSSTLTTCLLLYILWVYHSSHNTLPSPPLTSIPRPRRTNVYLALRIQAVWSFSVGVLSLQSGFVAFTFDVYTLTSRYPSLISSCPSVSSLYHPKHKRIPFNCNTNDAARLAQILIRSLSASTHSPRRTIQPWSFICFCFLLTKPNISALILIFCFLSLPRSLDLGLPLYFSLVYYISEPSHYRSLHGP